VAVYFILFSGWLSKVHLKLLTTAATFSQLIKLMADFVGNTYVRK
jgi:hypothetical protein